MGYFPGVKQQGELPPPYSPPQQSRPPQPSLPNALTLSTSPNDPRLFFLHPAGAPAFSPPLYSLYHDPGSTPNLVLYHGNPSPTSQLADASYSSGGGIRIQHRGQTLEGKTSTFQGKVTVHTPMGTWKWRVDTKWAVGVELTDQNGTVLAKNMMPTQEMIYKGQYPKKDDPRRKLLEIQVRADHTLTELICLTFVIAKINAKQGDDASTKVAKHLAKAIVGSAF